jgi:hypothetical protein
MIVCCDFFRSGQVYGEGLVQDPAELSQHLNVVLVEQPPFVRGDVEQQNAVAPDRPVIDLEQFLRRLDLVIFSGMVEPSGPN